MNEFSSCYTCALNVQTAEGSGLTKERVAHSQWIVDGQGPVWLSIIFICWLTTFWTTGFHSICVKEGFNVVNPTIPLWSLSGGGAITTGGGGTTTTAGGGVSLPNGSDAARMAKLVPIGLVAILGSLLVLWAPRHSANRFSCTQIWLLLYLVSLYYGCIFLDMI